MTSAPAAQGTLDWRRLPHIVWISKRHSAALLLDDLLIVGLGAWACTWTCTRYNVRNVSGIMGIIIEHRDSWALLRAVGVWVCDISAGLGDIMTLRQ